MVYCKMFMHFIALDMVNEYVNLTGRDIFPETGTDISLWFCLNSPITKMIN